MAALDKVMQDDIARARAAVQAATQRVEAAKERARKATAAAAAARRRLDGLARKKRDRARYVLGGLMMAQLVRAPSDMLEKWVTDKAAGLKPADLVLLREVLAAERSAAASAAAPEKEKPPAKPAA